MFKDWRQKYQRSQKTFQIVSSTCQRICWKRWLEFLHSCPWYASRTSSGRILCSMQDHEIWKKLLLIFQSLDQRLTSENSSRSAFCVLGVFFVMHCWKDERFMFSFVVYKRVQKECITWLWWIMRQLGTILGKEQNTQDKFKKKNLNLIRRIIQTNPMRNHKEWVNRCLLILTLSR